MWRLPAAQLAARQSSSSSAADAKNDKTTRTLHLHVGPRCNNAASSAVLRMWRLPAAAESFSIMTKPRYRQQQQSLSTTTTTKSAPTSSGSGDNDDNDVEHKKTLYLHVGPAGECWTGHSIFAAKHLQPDYVRSIAIPADLVDEDALISLLEDDATLAQQIYDQSSFPSDLMERLHAFHKSNETPE